jgi:cytochrome c-type biogenesis protein CcmH/NrfF
MNTRVLRVAWPGFLPPAAWIAAFLIVALFGKTGRRQLCKVLLWILPVFVVWTGWVMWIVVGMSNHAP